MRALNGLFLLLLSATPALCQTDNMIVGAWEWQNTTYSDGTVDTPSSVGYTVQIQFSADRSFLRYQDYALLEQSFWEVSYVWVDMGGGMAHLEIVSTYVGDQWTALAIYPWAFMRLEKVSGGVEEYAYMGPVTNASVSWGSLKAQYR